MPSNSAEYVNKNRLHLNKRAKLIYHNKTANLDYNTIHAYEAENDLDKTFIWVRIEALKKKLDQKQKPLIN